MDVIKTTKSMHGFFEIDTIDDLREMFDKDIKYEYNWCLPHFKYFEIEDGEISIMVNNGLKSSINVEN